jgi:hypothetical protein
MTATTRTSKFKVGQKRNGLLFAKFAAKPFHQGEKRCIRR